MSDQPISRPPASILAAYGYDGAAVVPITGGLINATFQLSHPARERVVIQALHPIFAPEVNLDIDAVTRHLASRGLVTPRLIPTARGDGWVERDGRCWRMLSYVDGVTLHQVRSPADAAAAGELAGRFHRALADLDHRFVFVRAGVHDTAAHLERLAATVAGAAGTTTPLLEAAVATGQEIAAAAAALPPLGELPRRPIHGDMKISNVRFAADRPAARCWVDLDTLGRQLMAYELGDALRSWCNPAGEDVTDPELDLEIFEAAIRGYAAGSDGFLSAAEVADLVTGVETVCVELAARFCVDLFDDSYFGWDPRRYASRREHNLVRARGQLALARSVTTRRAEAGAIVDRLLKK